MTFVLYNRFCTLAEPVTELRKRSENECIRIGHAKGNRENGIRYRKI